MGILRKPPQLPLALASATSANGTARNGATLRTNSMQESCLAAQVVITIVTGSVVCTVKWQGSQDNSTFEDIVNDTNTANTTVTATATKTFSAPLGANCFEYVRVVATLSGATTAAGDLTAATYRYRLAR